MKLNSKFSVFCSLFFILSCTGYEPTPPPAAQVRFTLDLPATATAEVTIYDADDKVVGKATALGGQAAEVRLTANTDFGALRLVAVAGEKVLKAMAPAALKDQIVQLEKVSADTTAATQLVQDKVTGQGGTFASIPSAIVADLLEQVASQKKQSGSNVSAFYKVVHQVLARAKTTAGLKTTAFASLDASLSSAFIKAHAKELPSTIAADYRNKLTAATGKLTINLVCDAAMVKVMFAVDASGKALDGNGTEQLIRQPTKGDKIYLAITVDESSPVADASGMLKSKMAPNDPTTAMFDDGTNGDEEAGDGVYTRVLVLPRGLRIKYKYTNGSAGEGWTRTEEWPGNARILEVKDVLSRHADGHPDCLVVRRDSFGDEASNKNFVNLHTNIKGSGGTLSFDKDLGGAEASKVSAGRYVGGLKLADTHKRAPLTPKGLPEARENGVCDRCPAPLTMSTTDKTPPRLVSAEFTSTSRIKISFSEAMEFTSASTTSNYLILDSSKRALAIKTVAASGVTVSLQVGPPDFGQTYTLYVKGLADASANENPLGQKGELSKIRVDPDRTPPQVVSVQARPLRDFNPGASASDPTVGQVIRVTFDEELDPTAAENAANFKVSSLAGPDLSVKAAYLRNKSQVWLVTGVQGKREGYDLLVTGVRDLAGNLAMASETKRFYGFALYKVTFGAVPGFAFLDLTGSKRGIPSGSKLYLTGTVLSVARDLSGNSIAVSGRTDVTGVPEFEMKPGKRVYRGKPVYDITLLAPAGSYAWKVAHGVEGEYKSPPPTLVKVHKSLGTTNDASGVNIDPATLTALALPGAKKDFLDYAKASLSKTGTDAPGPFTVKSGATLPAPSTMFKRENPDELCIVSKDHTCPAIVVGTWRDISAFKTGSKTNDYDDGQLEVDPARVQTDAFAPRLRQLKVRDSESLLLSFDERLVVSAATLSLAAKHAVKGTSLKVTVHTIGAIGSSLLPHQVLLKTARMDNGASYTLSYGGVADVHGNKQKSTMSRSWAAPKSYVPFTSLADTTAPRVISVMPKSPTGLVVQFNEKVLAADAAKTSNYLIKASSGTAPTITGATIQGGGTAVHLTTGLQAQQADYTLVVSNISDLASPPNLLSEQKVKFKGFGDSTAPKVVYAVAIAKNKVVVAFDEVLSPLTASAATSYTIAGLAVVAVDFSGDSTRKTSAFNPTDTVFSDNMVVLTTGAMTVGKTYTVKPAGVTDLSNNKCKNTSTFKGVASAPKVDVIFTYTVSGNDTVAGKVPPKAMDPATLASEREGVFLLGCSVSDDGKTKGVTDAVSTQMGTFPAIGQPLSGKGRQLLDDGQKSDKKSGDHVYTIRIKGVPLGTNLQWKAFASYKVGKSSFADAAPGPSVYSDGQEYPGNENGVRILGDKNGDGVVRITSLLGDEITYKKFTDSPPFVWVVDDYKWTP